MANLFWKTKSGVSALLATPFKTENEFEKIIFESSEILEDIFLLKRQIRGGGKPGIPDIIGIDSDGNICIIEMKNKKVDASIFPQVLQYAFWAERNPDSIKSLWLEKEEKPDDLEIGWDSLQVRILIIAPSIHRSTLGLVNKINYQIDLIEVKRWVEGNNQFMLVNKLEDEDKEGRIKPVSGLQTYNESFYKSHYNKKSAESFMEYIREVEKLVQSQGWPLETKFNKFYCGFKAGFFNAFGIKWIGSKTFAFFFKLPKEDAERIKKNMNRYEHLWKEAVYYIDPSKTKVSDFKRLFEAAFKRLTGD